MKNKRNRAVHSIQYRNCFTSLELMGYKAGNVGPEKRQKVFRHLNVERCSRCRDLYLSLSAEQSLEELKQETPSLPAPKIIDYVPPRLDRPERIVRGHIWITDSEPKDSQGRHIFEEDADTPSLLVLVLFPDAAELTDDTILRVLPLSDDTDFHCQPWTYLLSQDKSPLGYSVLIELFNERPMLAVHLSELWGTLENVDLQAVNDLRDTFLTSQPSLKDQELMEWQQEEIELSNFLSQPVNAMLWPEDEDQEETIIEEDRNIELVEYAKAADSIGIYLGETYLVFLAKKDNFSLTFVQKRDQVILEFISDTEILEAISLNTKQGEIVHKEDGLREINLGHVDQLPTYLDVEFAVNNVVYRYHLRFYRKNEES